MGDLQRYRKKIKSNRKNIFSAIDCIIADVKDLNSQLDKLKSQEMSEKERTTKATTAAKKAHRKMIKAVKEQIVKENKLVYDSISKIGKNIK
jgi:outer membrane murein-binding lipoprotein Lpp